MTKPALQLIKSDLPEKWQEILSDLITDPKELMKILELDPAQARFDEAPILEFPLKVPRSFIGRIKKGDWNDPLLRQVWPSVEESLDLPGYVKDPLAEADHNPAPGLLHKYHGRVLMTVAPHCAVHCRYCFRRHFDYAANTPDRKHWREALDYIEADSSIEEVIFSGGDPLAISDRHFAWLLQQLEQIPHLTTLRIHTRLPVVIPQRITRELSSILGHSRLKVVMVLHCNHSRELDDAVGDNLNTLTADGVILLNQSVLLRDVNDNCTALVALSKALFAHNVLPYYLHMPDKVAGTAHFDVTETKAAQLILGMQQQLPGYLVPTLVREEAGEGSKTRLL